MKVDMVTKTCPGGPQCLWQDFYHPVSPENQKALSTCFSSVFEFLTANLIIHLANKTLREKRLKSFDSLTFLFVVSSKNGE